MKFGAVWLLAAVTGALVTGLRPPAALATVEATATVTPQSLYSVAFGDASHGYALGNRVSGDQSTEVVVTTSDGGATWASQAMASMSPLAIAAIGSNSAWAVGVSASGNTAAIARTSDSGTSWALQTIPSGTAPLYDVDFLSATQGWAVGGGSLISTSNGGSTWTTNAAFQNALLMAGPNNCATVFFLDAAHGWVGCTSRSGGPGTPSFQPFIERTTDGGTTWSTTTYPQDIYSIRFTSAAVGFASDHTGVHRSTDGGATWTANVVATPSGALTFADALHGWALPEPGQQGPVMHTTDGGSTWAAERFPASAGVLPNNGPGATNAVAVSTSLVFFVSKSSLGAGAPAPIVRTTDGGATWTDFTDTLWVPRLYQDELGRPADSGGLASWIGVLDAASPLITVPATITASTEYRGEQVDALYQQLLKRASDSPGRKSFISLIAAGATYEQATASLVGSQEYLSSRGGGTNDGWLTAVYSDILNRTVDSGARTYWDGQFSSRSRTSIALAIVTSAEGLQGRIQGLYQHYLHRAADSGGLSFWLGAIQKGSRDEGVIASLASSPEYYTAAASY